MVIPMILEDLICINIVQLSIVLRKPGLSMNCEKNRLYK